MRGDRPLSLILRRCLIPFTPHARGSTSYNVSVIPTIYVYPACAGIDPDPSYRPRLLRRLPRMRGDRPGRHLLDYQPPEFTPHARGSTLGRRLRGLEERVYPACAGIDLPLFYIEYPYLCLPRMRGDRPWSKG